jgi:hypothetical protein
LSPDEFVAIISTSIVVLFSDFFRHLLSSYHFWKFNIFFGFERWCMHVNWVEAQYS